MSLKTVISITFVFMVLIVAGTILYSIADYLRYAGLFLLGVAGLFIVGLTLLSGLWLKERFDQSVIVSRKQNIDTIQDGLGQLFVIDHKRDTIRALTTNPKTHINGHFEEPTQAEMMLQALFFQAIGKGHTQHQLPAQVIEQAPERVPDILDTLSNADRVLVKGPSNAGKTTLFQNIAAQSQNVIVVDPHYAPGLWPEHCRIIGKGRNHDEITGFFDWLSQELDRRYKLRANGNEGYPNLTIIIDEWMSIANKCDNASAIITEMITESRKSKMRLFIGSHSDQVEALGIRGQGKLREGLLIVRLYYDQFTGERNATFDYGRGERPCKAPARYIPVVALPSGELPQQEFIRQLSGDEQIVAEMLANNESRSAIARRLFGGAGGNQLAKVDKIIAKIS